MKNKRLHKAILLSGILLSGALFSCAQDGGQTKGSPTYKVDYFDETGTQVGYAYAIEGKSAPFRSMDGTQYDWNPHSDLEITSPGYRYVFDKWVGTYDATYGKIEAGVNGKTVDINKIEGDCKLVATFKEEAYMIETIFKNDNKEYAGGMKVDFGDPLLFPMTNPTEEKPEYYNNYEFEGWLLSKDPTKHKFTSTEDPSHIWKNGPEKNRYAWGPGAPETSKAINNAGVIYLDNTLVDHMPLYETYMSNGTDWISLGKLSSNSLKLEYVSEYSKSYKDFTVTLYDANKTTVATTFTAKYADEIVYERSVSGTTTTIVVKYNDVTKHTYTIDTTNKIAYSLEGKYLNNESHPDKHDSKIDNTRATFSIEKDSGDIPCGGRTTLLGNISIYPLISDIH